MVFWMGLVFASSFDPPTIADMATRASFMNGTDLVVVMRQYPVGLPILHYTGPSVDYGSIQQDVIEIDEVLFGAVDTPYLYLWQWTEVGSPIVPEGIMFLERWYLDSMSGSPIDMGFPVSVVASDAVYGMAARQLTFHDNQVWGFFGRMCVNPADFLRGCEPGETPSTPDEVVAHLRSVLAGSPGLHLAGADPAGLPPRREASP